MLAVEMMTDKYSSTLFLQFSLLFFKLAEQKAFELNVAVMPQWKDIISPRLESNHLNGVKMNYHMLNVGETSSDFDKVELAIEFLEEHNTHALMGPFDELVSFATEYLNVTYLASTEVTTDQGQATFQVFPKKQDFSQAVFDMIKKYKWNKVGIFYDDSKGSSVLEKLLSDPFITLKARILGETLNEKQENLVHMKRSSILKYVVICRRQNVDFILEKALSLAMLSTPYEWFFYDPGEELTEPINNYRDIDVNITLFTLTSGSSSDQYRGNNLWKTLAEDSVALLQQAIEIPRLNETTAVVRDSLIKRVHKIVYNGKSGNIQFDKHRKRMNFTINLKRIYGNSTKKIGQWTSDTKRFGLRLHVSESTTCENKSLCFTLANGKLKVVTILEEPFLMYKRDYKDRKGIDRFEGFASDLIHDIATMLDFQYELYLVHDGKFGSERSDGSWDGLIGELLGGNATISVAPLSINSERDAVIDFSFPYMTRHVSVIMKKPQRSTSYFEFFKPLHPLIWLCTSSALVFVSLALFLIERAASTKQHSISLKQSFWLLIGLLLKGNTNVFPATVSGKLLVSFWWIFVLLLITSYTANLTAFLTVERTETPIKTVTDLVRQSKVKFGTVRDSGIMSYLKNNKVELFTKLWQQMSEDEVTLVNSTEEGLRKVNEESYAFFWDSTVIKHMTSQNCDLIEIGPPFGPKGFGIGMPSDTKFKDELSLAILKLNDNGQLQKLVNRWWKRRVCADRDKPTNDETKSLQIRQMAGVFFTLIGGVIVAVCVYMGKCLIRKIRYSVQTRKAMDEGTSVVKDSLQYGSIREHNDDSISS